MADRVFCDELDGNSVEVYKPEDNDAMGLMVLVIPEEYPFRSEEYMFEKTEDEAKYRFKVGGLMDHEKDNGKMRKRVCPSDELVEFVNHNADLEHGLKKVR